MTLLLTFVVCCCASGVMCSWCALHDLPVHRRCGLCQSLVWLFWALGRFGLVAVIFALSEPPQTWSCCALLVVINALSPLGGTLSPFGDAFFVGDLKKLITM